MTTDKRIIDRFIKGSFYEHKDLEVTSTSITKVIKRTTGQKEIYKGTITFRHKITGCLMRIHINSDPPNTPKPKRIIGQVVDWYIKPDEESDWEGSGGFEFRQILTGR